MTSYVEEDEWYGSAGYDVEGGERGEYFPSYENGYAADEYGTVEGGEEWELLETEEGHRYYYNKRTQESEWADVGSVGGGGSGGSGNADGAGLEGGNAGYNDDGGGGQRERAEEDPTTTGVMVDEAGNENENALNDSFYVTDDDDFTDFEDAATGTSVAVDEAAPPPPPAPTPTVTWEILQTDEGHVFYYNTATSRSQWVRPENGTFVNRRPKSANATGRATPPPVREEEVEDAAESEAEGTMESEEVIPMSRYLELQGERDAAMERSNEYKARLQVCESQVMAIFSSDDKGEQTDASQMWRRRSSQLLKTQQSLTGLLAQKTREVSRKQRSIDMLTEELEELELQSANDSANRRQSSGAAALREHNSKMVVLEQQQKKKLNDTIATITDQHEREKHAVIAKYQASLNNVQGLLQKERQRQAEAFASEKARWDADRDRAIADRDRAIADLSQRLEARKGWAPPAPAGEGSAAAAAVRERDAHWALRTDALRAEWQKDRDARFVPREAHVGALREHEAARAEFMSTNEALLRKHEEDVGALIKENAAALRAAVERAVADEKLAQRTRKPSGDMNFLGRRAMVQEHEAAMQGTRRHFEALLEASEGRFAAQREKWHAEREGLYARTKGELEAAFSARLRSRLEERDGEHRVALDAAVRDAVRAQEAAAERRGVQATLEQGRLKDALERQAREHAAAMRRAQDQWEDEVEQRTKAMALAREEAEHAHGAAMAGAREAHARATDEVRRKMREEASAALQQLQQLTKLEHEMEVEALVAKHGAEVLQIRGEKTKQVKSDMLDKMRSTMAAPGDSQNYAGEGDGSIVSEAHV
jgi:hypothetical protein